MPTLTTQIRPGSKLYELIREEVRKRVRRDERELQDLRTDWDDAENEVLAWLPEREADKLRRGGRETGGMPQYTTLKIPYTYANLMTAHTYWTNVFLARAPVFQYAGTYGGSQQNVLALETLIGYQYRNGVMGPNLYSWLFDGGRYGVGVVGLHWEEEIIRWSEVEQEVKVDPVFGIEDLNSGKMVITTKETDGYKGNKLYNIRPHNFLWDSRFSLREFQRGEHCSVRKRVSWNEMVRRQRNGIYTNIDKIDRGIRETFTDRYDDSALRLPAQTTPDQSTEAGSLGPDDKKHPDIVPVYECYIDLIPKEWNLNSTDFPQKWVFSVTADWNTVIGAQPLGARHGKFPFAIIEMEPDNYALANRGVPKVLDPVSRTVDWLLNSHFYNVRAALNNQVVVDPSRIVMKDVLDPIPGGVWRLKPAAYGTNPEEAYSQVRIVDVTQSNVGDMERMFELGERAFGVNAAMQGAPDTSGRKTATEVRTTTGFSLNRQKGIVEYMSETGWNDLSKMMVQNSQQFYTGEERLRRVGNMAQGTENFILVNPAGIAGFFDYIPVDGAMPIDRFAQASLWKDLMAQFRTLPALAQQYDLGAIFGHVAMLTGIRNLDQFRVQTEILEPGVEPANAIPITARDNVLPLNSQGQSTAAQIPGLGPAS